LTPNRKTALKARFSRDGKQIAYTNFTIAGSPSVFILDMATGKSAPLPAPDSFGYDDVLDWRRAHGAKRSAESEGNPPISPRHRNGHLA